MRGSLPGNFWELGRVYPLEVVGLRAYYRSSFRRSGEENVSRLLTRSLRRERSALRPKATWARQPLKHIPLFVLVHWLCRVPERRKKIVFEKRGVWRPNGGLEKGVTRRDEDKVDTNFSCSEGYNPPLAKTAKLRQQASPYLPLLSIHHNNEMPTQFDIKGKVIALTGAGQGIGYAATQLLASQGAIVSMADINEKTLNAAAAEFTKAGGTVMATVVDVGSEDSVNDWIKKTVEKFGKLDGAVNLAGVVPDCINKEPVEEHNTPDWKFVIDINLTGVFYCMRAQLQQMNSQGSIVNASSLCGGIGEILSLMLTTFLGQYSLRPIRIPQECCLHGFKTRRHWSQQSCNQGGWRQGDPHQLHLPWHHRRPHAGQVQGDTWWGDGLEVPD